MCSYCSCRFDVPLFCRCCPGWVVIGGDKKIQRRIQSIIHSRNDTTRYGMLHCFLTVWIYVHSKERKIERKKAQHMDDAPHVIRQTRKRSTSQVGEDHKQQTAIRTVCLVVVVDHIIIHHHRLLNPNRIHTNRDRLKTDRKYQLPEDELL